MPLSKESAIYKLNQPWYRCPLRRKVQDQRYPRRYGPHPSRNWRFINSSFCPVSIIITLLLAKDLFETSFPWLPLIAFFCWQHPFRLCLLIFFIVIMFFLEFFTGLRRVTTKSWYEMPGVVCVYRIYLLWQDCENKIYDAHIKRRRRRAYTALLYLFYVVLGCRTSYFHI